jgi:hypothetical protein
MNKPTWSAAAFLIVSSSSALAIPDAGNPSAPKVVPGFVMIAQQLRHPQPSLPDWFGELHAGQELEGTYRVCLGIDGRVTTVEAVRPVGVVDDPLMAQIQNGWLYKPQPEPVCFASTVRFVIKGIPMLDLMERHEPEQLEHPVLQPSEGAQVGIYAFCIGTDGKVLDVRALAGELDHEVERQIRDRWVWKPRDKPLCLSTISRKNGFTLKTEAVDHPVPSLPRAFVNAHARGTLQATYKVCVDEAGRVFNVSVLQSVGDSKADEHVMAQIRRGWTYKPQPVATCHASVLKFAIH